ncbi:mucin-5AC-like isoform X2 [Cheilinus undulatus]|uniref:mucin-5AC-like isoform X2 n=1 Tax=Cheilinus undulatus TaxID=241271 RepID=UPI001BD6D392|nr:mucin-5AC-like isoform X2 [Cheilinus undulatus]
MDILVRQEIYIPRDAEVKNISLRTLPNSVLNRMGLSVKDSDGSRKLADSAVGVWICPAVLRPKGQRRPSEIGNRLLENMSSKIAEDCRASTRRLQMSFVSSNKEAHKVLNETLHGHSVSADTSFAGVLPPDSAPHTYQVAVVIYQGRVYLSIRKPSRRKPQGETPDPQPEAKPVQTAPSTSDTTASNQKKRPAQMTSLKPSTKPPQKRLRIKLPSKSLKLPSNLVKRPTSTTAATTTAPCKAPSTAQSKAPSTATNTIPSRAPSTAITTTTAPSKAPSTAQSKTPTTAPSTAPSTATNTTTSTAPSTAITTTAAPTTPTSTAPTAAPFTASSTQLLHVNPGGTGRSQTKSKEIHSENRKDETNAITGSISSPQTTAPPPQTADRARTPANIEAAERQTAEETADWFQQQNNSNSRIQELGGGNPRSPAQSVYMNGDLQGNTSTWSGSRAWESASSAQQECDFTELEEEERIAQVKARLRQSEAALRNMKSS